MMDVGAYIFVLMVILCPPFIMSDPSCNSPVENQHVTNLFLKFDSDSNTILLSVCNPKLIWGIGKQGLQCFTNSTLKTKIFVKIKDTSIDYNDTIKTTYKLVFYDDHYRIYWCEANYKVNNYYSTVKSNYLQATKVHTFATFFQMPCDEKKICIKFRQNKENLEKQAITKMQTLIQLEKEKFKDLRIHRVKVMSREYIDENPQQNILVLCHILVSFNKYLGRFDSDEFYEDGQEISHGKVVSLMIRDKLNDLLKLINPNSSSVNSTEFCFREPFSNSSSNIWLTTNLGENSTTSELCLQSNLPITRRCVGDSVYGAMWESVDFKQLSCEQNITNKHIYEIYRSKQAQENPKKTMKDIKEIIENKFNDLEPVDLFYLGKIVRTISTKVISLRSTPKIHNVTETMISDIVSIYNNLMKVNVTVLKKSSTAGLNSTNMLLVAFEKLVDVISMSLISQSTLTGNATLVIDKKYEIVEINDYQNGAVVRITPKLVVLAIDPNVANVTGLAFYKSQNDKYNYTGIFEDNNCHYKFLYANQSVRELLEEDNLEIATFVPETLLNHLQANNLISKDNQHPRIVIKMFTNDRLFQEDPNIRNATVYNKIISLSIPGYDQNLSELLPLVMRKPSSSNVTDKSCRYWNYKTWATDGLEFVGTSTINKNLVWCGTWHLTSFAYLMGEKNVPEFHRLALDIVTLIGCFLSLVGIMGIFITAALFRKWWQKDSSKVLLQLSLAIALQMILVSVINTDYLITNKTSWSCIVLGAGLQYSVLVQFSWMMIIAFLQYKRYVRLDDWPERLLLPSFLIGWIVPLIPVLLVVLLDRQSYIPCSDKFESAICYPTGKSLYFGICVPVGLVIFSNLVIYIEIIRNVVQMHHDKRMSNGEIRVSVLLFFLLGLTWIFGILAAIKAGIVFSYLFSITATIQGFVLFVHFVILDPATRKMWTHWAYF